MNRKERIFQCVCQLVEKQEKKTGVDSVTISEELGLDRSNVSRDLNELAREGRIAKSEGRPVCFMEAEQYERQKEEERQLREQETAERFDFDFMIGQQGSLKSQIEQGKSAMLYPPRGLHTLLAGPTGTGKTTFAEKLYEYAVKVGAIEKKQGFMVFNCAEYSQNPQLLLSQLFGCRKGAYTGAERDKPGLVEMADGGILFLDEIHRLSPEGQEMLFLLMDKGVYRRLGETDRLRKASVLIIGATTENLSTALLKTFLRRMPVVIHLPALNERPIVERLQLIEAFFSAEQKKIGVPIRVYKEVIIALLLYRCTGNIGQLQADVQLLCAQAFLKYKVESLEYVTIELAALPEFIQNGRLEQKNQKNDLIEFLRYSDDYHIFEGTVEGENREESLYDIISRKYQVFKSQGRSEGQITGILQEDLDKYMAQLMEKYHVTNQEEGTRKLLKIIDAAIYYAVEEALQFAEVRLGRKLSDQARIGMMMHVNAMTERLAKGIASKGEGIQDIALNHPKEFRVARIILRLLEEELNIHIPKQELAYLTMFLCVTDETAVRHVGVLVLAHGNTTATSMAEVANQLMDTRSCKALDMPLDVSVETTLEKALEMIQEIDEGEGVIVLADMGSLTMLGEIAEQKTSVKIKTVPMVSTAIVLEAVRKSLMRGVNLNEVYESLLETGQMLLSQNLEHSRSRRSEYRIVATCFTGQGTAVKIRDILYEMLPEHLTERVQVQCMDFKEASDVKSGKKELKRRKIDAVVGTVDLQLDNVPFISVDELIIGSGIRRLERLLSGENTGIPFAEEARESVSAGVLTETLRGMLVFLNPDKMVSVLSRSLAEIMKGNVWKNSKELQVRYMVHAACMFERILQGEILPHKQAEIMKERFPEEFEQIRRALFEAEQMMRVTVPDSELAYLVEMIADAEIKER